MDKVSIIVPIYNVEKYLSECIDSIIQQTYKNIEIILIDDGSLDNCGTICDEYAKKDNRIRVIHKKNGGVSEARNCGIDIANGKYITFVDSDDYISNEYIEKLYNAIKKQKVQVSQCDYLRIDENKNIIFKENEFDSELKSGRDMLKEAINKNKEKNNVAWNKMYDINLFKDIRFPIGKIYEDVFVTYKIFYSVDKIAIVNECLYFYRQREGSIMHTKFSTKNYDSLIHREEKLKFFKENNEDELYDIAMKDYIFMLRVLYVETKKYMKNSTDIQKELNCKYKENYKYVLKSKYISGWNKLKTIALYISPTIYFNLRELLGR